jgi:hypothetical protein
MRSPAAHGIWPLFDLEGAGNTKGRVEQPPEKAPKLLFGGTLLLLRARRMCVCGSVVLYIHYLPS